MPTLDQLLTLHTLEKLQTQLVDVSGANFGPNTLRAIADRRAAHLHSVSREPENPDAYVDVAAYCLTVYEAMTQGRMQRVLCEAKAEALVKVDLQKLRELAEDTAASWDVVLDALRSGGIVPPLGTESDERRVAELTGEVAELKDAIARSQRLVGQLRSERDHSEEGRREAVAEVRRTRDKNIAQAKALRSLKAKLRGVEVVQKRSAESLRRAIDGCSFSPEDLG